MLGFNDIPPTMDIARHTITKREDGTCSKFHLIMLQLICVYTAVYKPACVNILTVKAVMYNYVSIEAAYGDLRKSSEQGIHGVATLIIYFIYYRYFIGLRALI